MSNALTERPTRALDKVGDWIVDRFARDVQQQDAAKLDDPAPELVRGAVAAGVFFVGLLGWAALTPLDAGVVAPGALAVSGNRQAVEHLDGGIVETLMVSEGDNVEAGQVLLELDDTDLKGQERALASRRIELEAQQARILAERAGEETVTEPERWSGLNEADQIYARRVLARQSAELTARSGATGSQITVLRRQRRELQARIPGQQNQYESIQEQLVLLDDELATLSSLVDRGLAPTTELRARERERANLQGHLGRIESEISQTRESISEVDGRIASLGADLGADLAAELREVETELADFAPRHDAIVARIERTQVRAPAAGEVVGLSVFTEGGVIAPGALLMDIVPVDSVMIIEASVPPESADDVNIGAIARVRLTGLQAARVPVVDGQVTKISADRLVDQQTGAPYYRLEVVLEDGEMDVVRDALGDLASQIRPGLPAMVVVPTRKRTALQYLFEPVGRAFWSSFRQD